MIYHRLKQFSTFVLGLTMMTTGYYHFRSPRPFVSIVPAGLPNPLMLVLVSGFFEIAGGLGLFPARTRKAAAVGLIALFVAVFPANINMAVNNVPIDGKHFPAWLLWLRLPLQAVLIAWAYWCADLGPSWRKYREGKPSEPDE